jgi:hypothetical protein
MKCLRIFATPDGESHFGDADIPATIKPLFANEAPFLLSGHYPASRIRFVHVPAGIREAGWHNPPGRVLTVWLDGIVDSRPATGKSGMFRRGASCWWRTRMEKGTSPGTPWKGRASF